MQQDSLYRNQQSLVLYSWQIQDHMGNISAIIQRKKLPWECPVCSKRFKWDVQLLRHERKEGHQNSNRKMRQENRYKKIINKIIRCTLCSSSFQTPLQRLEHMYWCQKDPRSQKNRKIYASSLPNYKYECFEHQVPYYFNSLDGLKMHIRSHKRFDQQKMRKIKKIFQWRKKWNWRGMTNEQYKSIAEKYQVEISVSTLKKIFKTV